MWYTMYSPLKKPTKSKLISFAVLPSSSRNPNNCYDKKYDCSYLTLTKYANCSISCQVNQKFLFQILLNPQDFIKN